MRSSTASSMTAVGPRTRSRIGRGALPGRNPATLVRRDEAPDGVADGAVETVGGDLDLEEDRALGGGAGGHIHRPASIGWVAASGAAGGGAGETPRSRASGEMADTPALRGRCPVRGVSVRVRPRLAGRGRLACRSGSGSGRLPGGVCAGVGRPGPCPAPCRAAPGTRRRRWRTAARRAAGRSARRLGGASVDG